MAIQQVNVYSFSIQLKTKQATGEHVPTEVFAVGATMAAAQQIIKTNYGSDLAAIHGGVLVKPGVFTSLA